MVVKFFPVTVIFGRNEWQCKHVISMKYSIFILGSFLLVFLTIFEFACSAYISSYGLCSFHFMLGAVVILLEQVVWFCTRHT